jgi:hypothetical protein
MSPPPLSLGLEELAEITPLVLVTGGGAIAYWRLRRTGLASTAQAHPFQQAYRLHALEGVIREQRLALAFARLRGAGLDALLGKGWAAARLYAETGLRPYGDIDLFVPASEHAAAAAALHQSDGVPLPVDLHRGFADLDDRDPDAFFSRSRTLEVEGESVRVFGPEDHLRLLCLHAFRHGVSRPLWLCDVAALVEAEARALDWDYLLQGSPQRTDALRCAIVLARELLGARLDGAPVGVAAHAVPSWLMPAVMRQWGSGSAWRRPIEDYLWQPVGALRDLQRHWPNPVAGTMGMEGPFDERPRFPFQLAYAARRLFGAVGRFVGTLRRRA